MLVLINMDILVTVFNSVHVRIFYGQMVAPVKTKQYQLLTWGSYTHIDIRNKKNLSSWWRSNTRVRKYHENSRRFALHYSRSNSFLFVNAVKIYQFKTKDSEIKPYPFFLGNIWKYFIINNMILLILAIF